MERWLFWEVMARGGPVMWGILAVSLVGVGLVVERVLFLRRERILPEVFADHVEYQVKELARGRSHDLPPEASPLERLLVRMARAKERGREAMEAEASSAGSIEVEAMGRGLELLGVLAQTAPLLGLLGTVLGLLRAFSAIAAARTVDPSVVAGGVAEALLTTVFGLVVGIPLLIAHRLLRARVNKYALALEEAAVRAMRALG